MIKVIEIGNLLESIEKYKITGLQNAANGIGVMGLGIAGAIRQYGGKEIQDHAFQVCNEYDPQPGYSYATIPGKLESKGIISIIHAVVMKQPGGYTNYDIVEKAFKSALNLAIDLQITLLGCTALGTGVGRLDSEKVAEIMFEVAIACTEIDIAFIDINEKFINKLKEF